MEFILSGALTAFWLGILVSVSPCPLATNMAAITFIGKHIDNTRNVLVSGIMYTLGRMLTYVAVAAIIAFGLLSIPALSHFLQRYMNMILGPVLILTGMFLLGMIPLMFKISASNSRAQSLAQKGNVWSACALGILFALSFCPVTAAIFFGSLLPLSLKYNSDFLMPALFGIGTGMPVFLIALIISFGAVSLNSVFLKISKFETWARRITGILLTGIGIYLSLKHVFEIIP